MQLIWRAGGVAMLAAVICSGLALAEGKGKGGGLARALSKAGGKGGAGAALGRAGQNLSRACGSLGRSGLGKAGTTSAGPLGSIAGAASRHQKQLLIEQRNRDQRLAQAEHLRQIAERNGDPELAANADRLAAFAQQHYQDRVAQLARFGVSEPTSANPPTVVLPELPLNPPDTTPLPLP